MYRIDGIDSLLLRFSWINDCLYVGTKVEVNKARNEIFRWFECGDEREFTEYLRYRVGNIGKKFEYG